MKVRIVDQAAAKELFKKYGLRSMPESFPAVAVISSHDSIHGGGYYTVEYVYLYDLGHVCPRLSAEDREALEIINRAAEALK
jgi:hypothetical protein